MPHLGQMFHPWELRWMRARVDHNRVSIVFLLRCTSIRIARHCWAVHERWSGAVTPVQATARGLSESFEIPASNQLQRMETGSLSLSTRTFGVERKYIRLIMPCSLLRRIDVSYAHTT